MTELDAFTRLRRGELIGLRWQDVDFEELVLHVRRLVVALVEGAPKTEASKGGSIGRANVPNMVSWKQSCAYVAPGDWVFAHPL